MIAPKTRNSASTIQARTHPGHQTEGTLNGNNIQFPITAETAIKWRSALYLIQMFKKCGQKNSVQTFSLFSKTIRIVLMTVQDF